MRLKSFSVMEMVRLRPAVSMGDGLSSAGDMATGDFNGDGKADIAVTGSTSIAVLMGNSVGIFAKPIVTVTNLTASGSLVLALGDVNSDSHLDAVVTDQNRGITGSAWQWQRDLQPKGRLFVLR